MTNEEIRTRLSSELGAQFDTREQGVRGTLFLTHATIPGGQLRLRIGEMAREDYPADIPRAVDRAIKILKEHRGDVVIREDEHGELVAVRESAEGE